MDSLKSDALKCPTSIGNNKTLRSIHETEETKPQGKYEGLNGIWFNKLNQLKQANEKIAELYRQ